MGDISEYRGIIVIVTFLLVLASLIAAFPPELQAAGFVDDTPQYDFNDLDVRGMVAANATYGIHIEMDPGLGGVSYDEVYTEDWGKSEFGHHMKFTAVKTYADQYIMWNEHGKLWLGFGFWEHLDWMDWINANGVSRDHLLSAEEIEADYDSDKNAAAYRVECEHFYFDVRISYNATAYASVEEAWADDELYVIAGIQWEQMGTINDVWSVLSSILLFKLPGGLESNWFIYAFVTVPMWAAGIYITGIIILRMIGALFGGGA